MGLIAMLAFTSLFGAGLICVGIYSLYQWWVRRNWESFKGEVISIRECRDSEGTTYYPSIRVKAWEDHHVFESEIGSFPSAKIGEITNVIGDPETRQFKEFGGGVFFLTVILPLCTGIGVAALGWATYTHNIDLQKEKATQTQP